MVLVLSDEDLASIVSLPTIADVVENALLKQAEGNVERPDRPHYPVGTDLDSDESLGTGLVMPAYLHGAEYFATKLVSLHEDNPNQGLPTLHAQLVLADANTGEPVSFMDATRITNARTGCVGGIAARELANTPIEMAVIGAGAQARWQTRAIDALTDVASISVYSPSDSKHSCVDDLESHGIPATAADSANAAVRNANVVVTATTSTKPVFSAAALQPGTLVVAIGAFEAGMQELEPGVFDRASRVFADVPVEVVETGDIAATSLSQEDLAPMASLVDGSAGRSDPDAILVAESVGSAVFDAATAAFLYDTARDRDVGIAQSL